MDDNLSGLHMTTEYVSTIISDLQQPKLSTVDMITSMIHSCYYTPDSESGWSRHPCQITEIQQLMQQSAHKPAPIPTTVGWLSSQSHCSYPAETFELHKVNFSRNSKHPGGCPLHKFQVITSMQLSSLTPSVWKCVKPRASCTALLSSVNRSAAPATPLGRKSSRAQVEAQGRRTPDMLASWKMN